jgi:hypothetical protein
MLRLSLVARVSLAGIALILLLILYMQSWPETQKDFMNWEQSEREGDSPVRLPLEDDPNDPRGKLIQKIVHLDLKGMPPLISYYEKLFPLLRRLGVT